MFAVIELGWNQFIVRKWDVIDVKKLVAFQDKEEGSVEALLVSDEDWKDVKIGTPVVKDSEVKFKVLDRAFKWEKVRVFKMKSKKRYARNRGFRPTLTKIEILEIK
jgi:large subunit ribosomal protein L21